AVLSVRDPEMRAGVDLLLAQSRKVPTSGKVVCGNTDEHHCSAGEAGDEKISVSGDFHELREIIVGKNPGVLFIKEAVQVCNEWLGRFQEMEACADSFPPPL